MAIQAFTADEPFERRATNPFTFQTTPNVLFEAGSTSKIAGLVSEFGARRVLFVTDKGVRGAGLTRDAEASLAAGCDLTVSRTWAPTRPSTWSRPQSPCAARSKLRPWSRSGAA